ncbi:hypothetical protein B0H16DRAFT_1475043 [Mycena metata]|uniref:Uncharacterized protein n=1 Tax=Mycena metata TaxID=1033252 RepID=A0AAD7HF21_9AGAR|nr:hypothetical protein B0H16DRAFT_1475043 [Mycena metata]
MHSTSTVVAPKQCTSEVPVVAPTTRTAVETKPVNNNGPQCAECGWRGGNHAPNCLFRTPLISPSPLCLTILQGNRLNHRCLDRQYTLATILICVRDKGNLEIWCARQMLGQGLLQGRQVVS